MCFFLSVSCVLNWGGPSAQIFLCVFYRGRPVENTSGNGCQKTPQVASGGGQPVTCDSVSLLFFFGIIKNTKIQIQIRKYNSL